jgi:general secretion pathway protein G
MNRIARGPAPRRGAFTLLELIVVITIIGLLGAIVVVSTRGVGPKARRARIDSDMRNILNVAEVMYTETGRFPETVEEMVKPTDANGNPLSVNLEEVPKDPWGNFYEYELVNGQPQVRCLGADGAEGGDDENGDVVKPESSDV